MQDTQLTGDDQTQLLGEQGLRGGGVGGGQLKLGVVAVVILREMIPTCVRMLWRVCKGNVILRQSEFERSKRSMSISTCSSWMSLRSVSLLSAGVQWPTWTGFTWLSRGGLRGVAPLCPPS